MEIKIEDIVFWIIILLTIGLAIWLLFGSPTDTASIIAIAIFVTSSEALIWRHLFKEDKETAIRFEKLDKKTAISFEKIKNNMDVKFLEINNNLKEIKNLIKR